MKKFILDFNILAGSWIHDIYEYWCRKNEIKYFDQNRMKLNKIELFNLN